tara:strand:- start:4054 stop:7287 length:3234 start_codon:yes stop_codon:yes gene_type:complete
MSDVNQLHFDFSQELKPLSIWPPNSEFPLNLIESNRSVETVVIEDLKASSFFTIITGFTSLSYLIDIFGNNDYPKLKKVKIVLGFEPNPRGRKRYHSRPLDKEIKEYWLQQGLSILYGGSIINLIEKIKNGTVLFKYKDKLHAKIYFSDNAAILGSSNFSNNGLKKQSEANIRLTRISHFEKYDDIGKIAENFFSEANDYKEIIALLQALIQKVSWKEALARAIAEILEGEWLLEYKELFQKIEKTRLWNTQWQGLTQAMTILQESSNVLIADPTGSGKTKQCAAIILALKHWLWENGRHFKDNSVIVCPPLVKDKWAKEFRELSNNSNTQISMGILSVKESKNKSDALDDLQIANILAIDEAHNYLNIETARSKSLRENSADYKLLITATPISKKSDDLLRLVELLDLDNLDDKNFQTYSELIAKPHIINETDLKTFKDFISKFTVRRTKTQINKLIDKKPEEYKNKLNKVCKFPEQVPEFYKTLENEKDIELADRINSIASNLKGITYLQKLSKPSFELTNEEKIKEYIAKRFNASKALARFNVRAKLRSSHVALYEHIYGTTKALEEFKFKCNKKDNLARVKSINGLIARNKLPRIDPIFETHLLPEWYSAKDKFIAACKEEVDDYKKIAALSLEFSGERELGKVHLMASSLKEHSKIVAFDSTIITLNYFKKLFKDNYPDLEILLATGSSKDGSEKVISNFNLESENDDRIIALCSDKMAEGVDLQKASAVFLLDMPSVLRIVEQRLGRIDRMDSCHSKITTFWPNDSEIFSLKGDRRLVEINSFVENTIGSNLEIPEELTSRHFQKTESIQEISKEFEEYILSDASWENINNSFQPIIDLKEGENAILSEDDYEHFKNIDATIKTRVSFLKSSHEWCFFALRGGEKKSPKWFFIECVNDGFHHFTDFPEICNKLRERTIGVSESHTWNDHLLKKFVQVLKEKEIELLPPKKRRALEVAKYILERKIKSRSLDSLVKTSMKKVLGLFENKLESVDYEMLAELWLKVLTPHLENKRNKNKSKRKVFNLNSLKTTRETSIIEIRIEELDYIYENCPISDNINTKIASCIIGFPKD